MVHPVKTKPSTIVVKGDYVQHEEGRLAAAATPGMSVVMTATAPRSRRFEYTPGAVIGGGLIMVLKENALEGKTIDDAYDADTEAFIAIPKKGDVINVLVAAGQNLARNAGIKAAASGKWVATDTDAPAAVLLEPTGGALAEDTHIIARVL